LIIFGDTGLLFAYKQWGTATATADGIIHNLVYPIAVNNVRSIIVTHSGDDVAMTAVLSKYVTKSASAIKITDHAYVANSFSCYFLIIGD
jgi:hypothetical protein